MREFRLKRKYPGSPELGTFVKETRTKRRYVQVGHESRFFSKKEIEEHPDFWEERTKLLTTEDGVDIYEGDEYFSIDPERGSWLIRRRIDPEVYRNKPSRKYFSTRHKAREWVILNKPCLSINEIIDEIPTNPEGFISRLKELVKSKIKE